MPTRHIALIVDLQHTVRREVVRSIVESARQTSLWNFDLQASPPRQADPNWDGVFAWPTFPNEFAFLQSLSVPVVCLGSSDTPGISRIGFDNLAVGRMAVRHFLDRGIRHFGFVGGEYQSAHSRARLEGFQKCAGEHGLPCTVFPIASSTTADRKRCGRALQKWVADSKAPSGLFADTDRSGHQVLQIAREYGLRVPEQLAVLGVGADELFCAISSPALSSIVLPGSRMGTEAVNLMNALLASRKGTGAVRLVPPEFLSAKESSDIYAMPDPMVARTLRIISDRAGQPMTVGEILREIPLSRRLLEVRFKLTVGRTIQKQIWNAHLDRARRLLTATALSMPDVAEQSGFRDAQRLSEVFRRELGESPSAYRARLASPTRKVASP
jgi:LacI family transcriptional regulator